MQTPVELSSGKDLIIAAQKLEIEKLRIELQSSRNQPIGWLSPVEVEQISEYSAYQIRRIVDRAIDDPESELIDRYHYKRRRVGGYWRYRINWVVVKELI